MSQRSRKIKKRNPLYLPLSFLAVSAALLFGLSVFFRVSGIEVEGNSLYTADEIIEASGIEEGDNLFFLNRFSAVSRIYSKLAYVESSTINRRFPNKVVISIVESQALAYVTAEDGYWAIDRSCKLLSNVDSQEIEGLIRIDGLTPIAPKVGDTIAAGESETPKINYLKTILEQIHILDIRGDIGHIDISNVANPSFDYVDRFTVKLGTNSDVEYKFQLLISAVNALAEGDRGTLDLSIDKRAHLTYD